MKKSNKNNKNTSLPENGEEREKVKAARTTLLYLLFVVVNTVVFYALYAMLVSGDAGYLVSQITMWTYFALLIGFFCAYIIYNKGFTMVNRTPDSFPEDWSYEKMCAVTEEGERRKKKSKWMLLIIIPLLFTFMFDMIDLFIIDRYKDLF
ncbi:MAG: hypothetical protein IJF74_03405 [Clostridia bacterium]|nr:hypothetical protein [Clostridia bacterium]